MNETVLSIAIAIVLIHAVLVILATVSRAASDRQFRSLSRRIYSENTAEVEGALSELAALELTASDLLQLQRFAAELSQVSPARGIAIFSALLELRIRRQLRPEYMEKPKDRLTDHDRRAETVPAFPPAPQAKAQQGEELH